MEFRLTDALARVEIRRAQQGDLDAIADLEARAFAFNRLSRRALARHLANPSSVLLLASASAVFAGYALLLFRPNAAMARLYSIAVEPRARGVGRILIAACEDAALARCRVAVRLEVRADNRAAIRLYERLGYRCFGRYETYYEDGCAALRYERLLWRNAPASAGTPPHLEAGAARSAEACARMALFWAGATLGHVSGRSFDSLGIDNDIEPEALVGVLSRRGLTAAPGAVEAVDEDHVLIVRLERQALSRRPDRHWVLAHGRVGGCVVFNDPCFAAPAVDNVAAGRDRMLPLPVFQRMTGHGRHGPKAGILVTKGSVS